MAEPRPVWSFLNQPFTIWALTVVSASVFLLVWRPHELELQRHSEAQAEHEKLHSEVKSRLLGLRDAAREHVSAPELRRSLDTGATANINREMDTRSLRSLAMEHDELVASGRIHCPVAFGKTTESIYDALRSGSPESAGAAKTGVESLLSQLSGGGNPN